MDRIGNRFQVKRLVGLGSSAAVHLCDDLETGTVAAVKILHPSTAADPVLARRFLKEIEVLRRVRHPHLVRVIASGVEQGIPWYACTYAHRGSLADLVLREGGVPTGLLLRWIAEVLEALEHVHAAGIVHRDVKPENILVDEADHAVLGDFGVALVPDDRQTQVDAHLGTAGFKPPEQHVDPTRVGPETDLYALAVSLFVSATKQSGMLLLMTHTRASALASLPVPLQAFVDRATAVDPRERFHDARAMLRALDVVRAGFSGA